MTTEIIATLEKFIATEIAKQPERSIAPDEKIISSGLIDSFSLVDLGLFVEDTYDVRIEDNPSESKFKFCQVNGVRLAIRRSDLHRLDGAQLDFQVFGHHGGFIFDNPNAPKDVLNRVPDD